MSIFNTNEIMAGVISAIGGIIGYISIHSLINGFLSKYVWFIFVIAILLMVFANKIQQKIRIDDHITKTVSGILLFISIKDVISPHIAGKTAYVGLVVMFIFIFYRRKIADFILTSGG